MRFIKAEAVTVGGTGFYSACEEPEYVSREAFLPANDLYFAQKEKKNNIWKHQAAVEDFDDYL